MQTTFNAEEQLKIIELYSKNLLNTIEISKIYNCSPTRITWCLKINNIKMRTHGESYALKQKFSFVENFDAHKSYLLGIIYGDGNLDRGTIGIGLADIEILQNINKIFNNELKISKIKNKNAYKIRIYGVKLTRELKENFNLCEDKSDKLIFPKNIPNNLIKNFIIGFLDTDGSILYYPNNKNKFEIHFYSCSKIFLEEMRSCILHNVNITTSAKIRSIPVYGENGFKRTKNRDQYRLSFYATKALKICDWLYSETNETLRLNRKYEKYIEYKTWQNLKMAI